MPQKNSTWSKKWVSFWRYAQIPLLQTTSKTCASMSLSTCSLSCRWAMVDFFHPVQYNSYQVYFDPILWQKLLDLSKEKYDMARPVMPSRLHFQSKKLRAELGHFVKTHTRFVLEVPSLWGEMVFNIPDTYISPYQTANCFKESNLDLPCF